LLKEALRKPIFKCGVVHHKIGSPCYSYTSNTTSLKHNKKAASTLARPEHSRLRQKTAVVKETSFAPPNFKFKVVG
jgi:hypothetical protein